MSNSASRFNKVISQRLFKCIR